MAFPLAMKNSIDGFLLVDQRTLLYIGPPIGALAFDNPRLAGHIPIWKYFINNSWISEQIPIGEGCAHKARLTEDPYRESTILSSSKLMSSNLYESFQ